ncbi:tyrosine-type recombinase/integrase [Paracoccus sp. (in: a-proteobacteria)]|uniref:tyrosine-type recombinase/integrase n=1 Tax=Paracoccus sp. TaxID=267 RepID=UPI003A87D863
MFRADYHSWTLEEIEKFEKAHPVGATPRLAMALALYTGQRLSDIVQFGKQHVRDGWLIFTQFKGRENRPVRLELPIIPELQRIIDASATGDLTFLKTAYGKPYSSDGLGNRMREWCDKAGLSDCSTHGLRKAAASRLAELGCTEFEIMAITGHQTSKKVTRYTKAASQRLRAESALAKLTGTKS